MPTLLQYRQQAAKELGAFFSGAAVSGSTTSALSDSAWPIYNTSGNNDEWVDAWLLRPNAANASDKVRRVKTYTPASGLLLPDHDWTVAPAAAEAYELHAVVEPLTAMTDLINEALKRCLVVVEASFTPTATQTRQSLLTALPWLTDPDHVRQAGYLSSGDSRTLVNPYDREIRGTVELDGGTPYLETPGMTFQATSTIYLKCIKRGYDHCAPSAGSYGSQSGLSLESDKAPPVCEVEWVAAATLVEAWRRYSQILETAARQRLMPNRVEAAATFSKLTRKHFTRVRPEQRLRGLLYGGPRALSTRSAYRASSA